MNRLVKILLSVCMLLMTGMAFAQSIEIPEVNVLEKLGNLVLNWNAMSDLMKGSIIVMVIAQVIKQASHFKYKRFLVVILSVIYGVGQMVIGGEGLGGAIVSVLVSGGGAMAIYESLKPLLKNISFLQIGDK